MIDDFISEFTGHKVQSLTQAKFIDNDDIHAMNENEDKEVLESLAAAEKQLGHKMPTPKKIKGHPWEPVKYDVEEGSLA